MRDGRTGTAARALLALVLLGLIAWGVLNSAIFSVRDVRLIGLDRVERSEVLTLAALEDGTNLIMLATDDVAERLTRHPWIADAQIDRDLPSTLVVTVRERRAVGWVEDAQGRVLLSDDGTVLERVARPKGLPRVGAWPQALTPGERTTAFAPHLRMLGGMSAWLRARVAAAEIDDGDALLELRGGGLVVYGQPSEVGAKSEALERMLRWAEDHGVVVETADVRVPAAPSLQPERGSAVTETPFS